MTDTYWALLLLRAEALAANQRRRLGYPARDRAFERRAKKADLLDWATAWFRPA
jgi:hypothetical protein